MGYDKYKGHTEGPWTNQTGVLYEEGVGHIQGPDAWMGGLSSIPTTEHIANAQLIADAPMLLEQNKRMIKRLKAICNTCWKIMKHSAELNEQGKDNLCDDCQTYSLIKEIEG